MEYNFRLVEKKWQEYWRDNGTNETSDDRSKPKCYVLDMFPYPSGAGLHVGHPLGYIASDIYSRYKKLTGYNVLHPMGYDSFGLPAEQYAIQTGQHPAVTTEQNISRYREQLDRIGLSFDWSREVRTSDPSYYKWTQWIFIRLFNSWYNEKTDKAEPIDSLIDQFDAYGNAHLASPESGQRFFSADEWRDYNEEEKSKLLLNYRLAYISEATVNWCPAMGTVLANEEVKDGVSERGGYPVEKKLMKQWSLRITSYADRLLRDLEKIDWPEPIKEQQRNWIGKSEGAEINFHIAESDQSVKIFTTRPDTIFGATYLTLAPENELIEIIVTDEYRAEVMSYVTGAKNRSERERMAEVKNITGIFTGAYAIHPFTGEKIPVWTADYVLGGYGTGAVMAVPAHDSRDYAFARHFNLPIKEVVTGGNTEEASYDEKEGKIINSDFLNGLEVKDAIGKAIIESEVRGFGKRKVNYRLRDAIFGRQRYWGEPIPVYYKGGIPYVVDEKDLPVVLPSIDKYLPTEDGEPPLARATDWKYKNEFQYETTTMPGWAGSSWYFLRYMDPHNDRMFVSPEKVSYWNNVDLYIGGAEHATGHLLYVRFWTKFLFDLGLIPLDEPAQKLINQGMIQGRSNFVYRIKDSNRFVSAGLKSDYDCTPLHVDVNIVDNDILDIDAFKKWRPDLASSEFILEDGKYFCGTEVEKMSKSKWNVVSPDLVIEKYGADCLRLYEMFLGPLELSKPWNTNGISGTSNFMRKLWKLFHRSQEAGLVFEVSDEAPSKEELKILHRTIKKVTEDINRFSFNTSVSTFMICVNELTDLKCNKREILEPLTIIVAPYAPHIAEELYHLLGHTESVMTAGFPVFNDDYLTETEFAYPISINGKTKLNLPLSLAFSKEEIEREVMNTDEVRKLLSGKEPKKIVVVPGRIVNIVI